MASTIYFVDANNQTYLTYQDVTAVTSTTKTLQTLPYSKEFQTVLQYPMAMAFSSDMSKPQAGELRVPALVTDIELAVTQASPTNTFNITPTYGDKADSANLTQDKRQDNEVVDYWQVTTSGTGVTTLFIPMRLFPTYTNVVPVLG